MHGNVTIIFGYTRIFHQQCLHYMLNLSTLKAKVYLKVTSGQQDLNRAEPRKIHNHLMVGGKTIVY